MHRARTELAIALPRREQTAVKIVPYLMEFNNSTDKSNLQLSTD